MYMKTHAESHVWWHQEGGGGGRRANSTRDYDGKGWVPDEFIGLYLWFHKCIWDFDAFLISQMHLWFWGECPHKCICAPIYICDLGVSALHLWFKYKTNGLLSIWCDIKMSKDLIIEALKTFGCNTLQHTTTHCNTLQHTATHLHFWGSLTLVSRSSYIDVNALIIEALQTFGILLLFY